VTIDIDRDSAHDAAQHELSKPIYPKASLTDRIYDWIGELLYKLAAKGASLPGGWFTLTVLLILLIVGVVVAVRIARRTMRTNRGGRYGLFGEHELSAAVHRETAEQYAAAGNWAAAIRHRLRAVARQLEETAVLDPVPGRTATELARDAGRVLPELDNDLRCAAIAFNDVTYGGRPGTESAYRMIADLDDHIRLHTRGVNQPAAAPANNDWAQVR
jgi:predicted DCC family thiol-disulfide oxidoreductase YuxK